MHEKRLEIKFNKRREEKTIGIRMNVTRGNEAQKMLNEKVSSKHSGIRLNEKPSRPKLK